MNTSTDNPPEIVKGPLGVRVSRAMARQPLFALRVSDAREVHMQQVQESGPTIGRYRDHPIAAWIRNTGGQTYHFAGVAPGGVAHLDIGEGVTGAGLIYSEKAPEMPFPVEQTWA